MTDWEKLERMAFVLGEIARGRIDNGRPLDCWRAINLNWKGNDT